MIRGIGQAQSAAVPSTAVGWDAPANDDGDRAIIRYLCERLAQYLGQHQTANHGGEWLYLPERDERQHRLVLLHPAALRGTSELTFVAFFGQKRPDADDQTLAALDAGLIGDFAAHPYLLSYSSLQLADGNWANLVLMNGADGISAWAGNERHAYASRTIAPACYLSIRLHRGSLPQGLRPQAPFEIRQTQRLRFGPKPRGS